MDRRLVILELADSVYVLSVLRSLLSFKNLDYFWMLLGIFGSPYSKLSQYTSTDDTCNIHILRGKVTRLAASGKGEAAEFYPFLKVSATSSSNLFPLSMSTLRNSQGSKLLTPP